MKKLLMLAGIAALVAWFFDREQGARRRRAAVERAGALTETAKEAAPDGGDGIDDVTLKRKVETEIFRPEWAPKGDVVVDAVDGRVTLRGEVETTELIDELVNRARDVEGVEVVESLLHVPGTEAPMRD